MGTLILAQKKYYPPPPPPDPRASSCPPSIPAHVSIDYVRRNKIYLQVKFNRVVISYIRMYEHVKRAMRLKGGAP